MLAQVEITLHISSLNFKQLVFIAKNETFPSKNVTDASV